MPADLLAERLALAGVLERRVEARPGQADRARRDGVAAVVDSAHGDLEALALLADAVLQRHAHVVEVDLAGIAGVDAELALDRARGQTGHAPLDDERADATVFLRPVERGEDQEVVGDVGQADPDLGAVEDVRVAVTTGGRGQAGGVGAGTGLGQPERGQLLALRLGREETLLLILRAPLQQGQRVEPDVHAHHHPKGRIGALELLAQDAQADVVQAGPAVLLGDRCAQEAQLAHPAEHLAVHFVLGVPLADMGLYLGGGEVAHGRLDETVLVGQR